MAEIHLLTTFCLTRLRNPGMFLATLGAYVKVFLFDLFILIEKSVNK